jgi:flagellar basal-body rod protein FlgG
MQAGYYNVTGAMVTQFNRVGIITNNLANINTNGYKKDGSVIGTFQRLYDKKRDILPLQNHTVDGAKFLNRAITKVPRIIQDYTEFDIGSFKKTSNPLDVAIKAKNGFFKIKTEYGNLLTKDGSFKLDENGILVTKDGNMVLDTKNKAIEITTNNVVIDKDGTVFGNNQAIATIAIIKARDLAKLSKVGNNLYKSTDLNLYNATSLDLVRSGFVESSNVNAISEMVGLIDANRLVGMYQKVMNSQMDDMNNEAINKLASTKA